MLVTGIKSRPVYPGLEPDLYAKQNVIVCDAPAVPVVGAMVGKAGAQFASRTTLLLIGPEDTPMPAGMDGVNVWHFPTLQTAMTRFDTVLSQARMGLRVYAAGTEPVLGAVVQKCIGSGIDHNSVRTEHVGSTMRRVQCVHCKGFIENVTTNPVTCTHCGLPLLVRDHYSRRLGAFMGVRIDAEAPGEVPSSAGEFQ